MPLIDLPPQVCAECDGGSDNDLCQRELEYDGITMHFEKAAAASGLRDYDWRIAGDGKVYCEECANPWCDACNQPLGRGACDDCRDSAAFREEEEAR